MVARLFSLSLIVLSAVNAALQASEASLASSLLPSVISVHRPSIASSTPSAVPSLTSEERDKLFILHEELVDIPSISNDETECAEYVSKCLKELGYHVEKVPVGNTSTYNVFAYPTALKDEGVWPEVLITSHIDTVRNLFRNNQELANSSRYHHSTPLNDERRMARSFIMVVVLSMPKVQSQP
jgi:acetylornithine deacetylase